MAQMDNMNSAEVLVKDIELAEPEDNRIMEQFGATSRIGYGGKDGAGNSNTSAQANSGGGGGGQSYNGRSFLSAGSGGSGIVIIRNTR